MLSTVVGNVEKKRKRRDATLVDCGLVFWFFVEFRVIFCRNVRTLIGIGTVLFYRV